MAAGYALRNNHETNITQRWKREPRTQESFKVFDQATRGSGGSECTILTLVFCASSKYKKLKLVINSNAEKMQMDIVFCPLSSEIQSWRV